MRKPSYWNKAKSILSKKDKVMKKLINSYKDGALVTRNDVFFSLCKSIIGQQISVAAANSVFLKFKKSCKGKITARNVNKLSRTKELSIVEKYFKIPSCCCITNHISLNCTFA